MQLTIDLDPQATREWMLRYRDADGYAGEWIILPLSVHGKFDETGFNVSEINASCGTPRSPSTFRFDRVIEVGDLESGERISADEWIESLSFERESRARAIQLYCYYVVLREKQKNIDKQEVGRRPRPRTFWKISILIGAITMLARLIARA